MSRIEKVLYTAKTHTTGGREPGASRSSDGRLDVKLSSPGTAGAGTNPEQLFAAGWSACFERRDGTRGPQDEDRSSGRPGHRRRSRFGHNGPAITSCKLASTSACRVWIAASPSCWWTPRTRFARIPRAIRGNVDVAINLI